MSVTFHSIPDTNVAAVDTLATEYASTQASLADARTARNAYGYPVNGVDTQMAEAKADDDALLAAAARDGDPIDEVGTPTQDALAANRAEADAAVRAWEQALADVADELTAAIASNASALTDEGDTAVTGAASTLTSAITTLQTAHDEFLEAIGTRNYWQQATTITNGRIGIETPEADNRTIVGIQRLSERIADA